VKTFLKKEEVEREWYNPLETLTLRRVRARGLQAPIPAPVGRVPSRGVLGCKKYAG